MRRLLKRESSRWRGVQACLAVAIGSVSACGPSGNETAGESAAPAAAEARLFAETEIAPVGDADVHGKLLFDQDGDFLRIDGRIDGLPPGRYLLHVHEAQECAVTPRGFAGPIFSLDSGSAELALDPELPNAAGNLGEFAADDNGNATLDLVETTVSVGNDPRSVTNRSIVVHRAREMSRGAPVPHPGEPIACGTIRSTLAPQYVR